MTVRRGMRWMGLLMLLLLVALTGCKKKPAAAPPPTPPPPPAPSAPTATLRATPSVIERGQSTTLSWNSTNATELQLAPGPGSVGPQGSTSVTPDRSTTYTLVATGPGGKAEASARVTVNAPPPPPPPARMSAEEAFAQRVRAAYFDFDKSDVRPDARDTLTRTAEFLREYGNVRVLIEGHCDERGSTEYNLGLGDRRANAARDFLISLGIAGDRMQMVSYGKERPICTESDEGCWQRNRRAHFVMLK